jgi:nucleoside-diphosphate-sugar epimerase
MDVTSGPLVRSKDEANSNQARTRWRQMRLTIFGATGGVGRHVLEQAVSAGHDVTAVVRDPRKLTMDVRTITADLSTSCTEVLESAIGGADAVLSGLGPRKKAEYGIAAASTRGMADGSEVPGVRRLVVVSGVGVSTIPTPGRPNPPRRDPGAGLVMQYVTTPLARTILGRHFVDVALMEDFLRGVDLDWTVMRMPQVVDRPPKGVVLAPPDGRSRLSTYAGGCVACEEDVRVSLLPCPQSVMRDGYSPGATGC